MGGGVGTLALKSDFNKTFSLFAFVLAFSLLSVKEGKKRVCLFLVMVIKRNPQDLIS